MVANQIALSHGQSVVIGVFTLNGRATVADNRGPCTVMKLTSWVPLSQLVHAKCSKDGQRRTCIMSIELILETE